MQDPNSERRGLLGIFFLFVILSMAVGGGTAWFTWNALQSSNPQPTQASSPQSTPSNVLPGPIQLPTQLNPVSPASPTPTPTAAASPQPTQSPLAANTQTAKVYWLRSAANKTELASANIATPIGDSTPRTLTTAFENLLAGPADVSVTTTIPTGTKLLGLKIAPDGIHVDLSKEFKAGGGTESMKGRVGQVVFTATSLQPRANVWISVEGKPLEVLGGEGLVIDQPLTRTNYEQNFL
jgi:spore germination protein GerM